MKEYSKMDKYYQILGLNRGKYLFSGQPVFREEYS